MSPDYITPITVASSARLPVRATTLSLCPSSASTTKFGFPRGWDLPQSRCPTRSRRKTRQRRRQWAEPRAAAAISLAVRRVRRGRDPPAGPAREGIVVACCAVVAAFLQCTYTNYQPDRFVDWQQHWIYQQPEAKDAFPNTKCMQAAERAKNAVLSLVTLIYDHDIQPHLSEGPNTSSV